MNNVTDPTTANKLTCQIELLPSGDSILEQLAIEPSNIKNIKPRSQRTQYRAVVNWLTKYQISPAASNLDRVRGLLEAFYHLCELKAWSQSRTILVTLINVSEPEKLHNQLRNWGYYHEQSELYQKLLGKLDRSFDAFLLTNLGITCTALGKQNQAIDYYQQSLELARRIEDISSEVDALGSLGIAHYFLSNYTQAIEPVFLTN